MKAFSKITILAAAAAFLCSCEMEYYKEELYRKEIFIVSGENNILGQEFEYGEKGFQGELAIYASGTTGLDQNVTVKLGLDFEAIGEYNKRNFDTKFEEYAMELPAEYYTIDPMSVEMEAGSCSASLPINVRVDELLPDQTYFIPLRIESVSSCMPSATKNFVLFEIQRRNDYATTKSSTYYTMTGTTQTGWIVDNIFGSNTRRQAINSSKLVIPVGERSVRILPGATAANDKVTTRNNSLRVTVDPESWVNVPVYVEGEITDEVVPMQRVSITPYLDSQDAIRVSAAAQRLYLRPCDRHVLPLLPLPARHRKREYLARSTRNDDPLPILILIATNHEKKYHSILHILPVYGLPGRVQRLRQPGDPRRRGA